MKKTFFPALAVFLFLLAVSVHAQFPKYLYGIISYYGDDYAGKITASGEAYDPENLTAAHPTLPFGTEVEIENLENGRKARVRINDRGPMSDSKILDVSRRTAEQLGFLRKGTVYTRVAMIRMGNNKTVEPPVTSSAGSSSSSASSAEPAENPMTTIETVSSAPNTGVASSLPVKYNVIARTNVEVLYETNYTEVTNYNDLTTTNVIEIPPYEDKFIEEPVEERVIETSPDASAPDEFILDEPEEVSPEPTVDNSVSVTGTALAPEPELLPEVLNDSPNTVPEAVPVKEDVRAPESLLLNEEAVNLEKMESRGEAVLESGREKGNYNFVVQAGAFRKNSNALRLYDKLKSRGFNVFTTEAKIRNKSWVRVRIGYFSSLNEVKATLNRLKDYKIKGFMVKIKK